MFSPVPNRDPKTHLIENGQLQVITQVVQYKFWWLLWDLPPLFIRAQACWILEPNTRDLYFFSLFPLSDTSACWEYFLLVYIYQLTFKRIPICLKYRETLHLYEECRMPQVSVFDFFLQQALEFLLCDPFPLPAQMFKDFGCCTFSRALRWCLFLRKARKLTQKCTYLAIVLRLYFFQLFIAGRKKYFIFGLYSILNLPGISFDG